MSNSIDERVVRLTFLNSAFEQNVAQSIATIDKFNKALKLDGAAKGLSGIGAAAASQNTALKNVESSVQSIADRFKTMSVVATTALVGIAQKAFSVGSSLVKSLTLDPVMDGFREYETNIGSIQTILANTGLEGQKGLDKVNAALNDLNHYSDQTIYNFTEMARNIGTFTAAGVKLDTATAAIKGIANLAAVSGSNSEQASTAMYQLSQAISAGKVSLEDWNSVVNAGMGGKVFQNALMETARVHGVAIDEMVKSEGSFRNTLQKGWLTSSILTETLNKFTGDLSAKQLKAMGYNEKQIAGILKMGKVAQDAATKVKTMSQLISTLQEAVGSGWTQTWQLIFGDFGEAKTLFTDVSNTLGDFINTSSNARNKILGDWKELGGRTVLIDAIGNAFHALIDIVRPVKDAFREIFPATTGKQLYDLTVTFRNFTKGLIIGSDTADKLKRTFAGIFAVFGIGVDIIKEVAKTFFSLIGVATKGSGGILDFTAKIGDFLVAVRNGIKEGHGLEDLFKGIGTVLAIPIKLVQKLIGYLASLFDSSDSSDVEKSVEGISSKLEPLGNLGKIVSLVWGKVLDVMHNIGDFADSLGEKLQTFFNAIGLDFSSMFDGLDFSDLLASINTGLFGGLVLLIRKFTSGAGEGGGLSDIVDAITDGFDALTGSLKGMQHALNAAALLQIAIAVGILAVSMNTLAKIDQAGLIKASSAITVMFTQLLGSLAIFQKFIGTAGFAKLPFVMGSLILLAAAVDILAVSVKKLSVLDWNGLAKGLTGVTVLLAGVVAALKFMPNPAGMISSGLGLIALATGIKILASAVTDISDLSWDEMARGLVGVGALLGSLVLFTMFSKANASGVVQGAGIVLLAAGIKILASALKDLSSMSWEEIGKGLTAMAGGLALIGAALYLIPPTSVFSAAGVLLVATSLGMIGDAMKSMGNLSWTEIGKGLTTMAGALVLIGAALYLIPPTALLSAAGVLVVAASLGMIADGLKDMASMSWEEIGKGLTTMAGALGIITLAMMGMTGALPGAAALLVVVASLRLLTPVLVTFSQMSWEEIAKGLLMLAGVFGVIGLAGLVLAPLVPVLIGLGTAITLLGIGVLAAGAGVFLFASALTALAAAGTVGAAAMVTIVTAMLGLIPKVMKELGEGVIAFAQVIGSAGPAITKAITTVLLSLIDAIGKLSPKIISTFMKMLALLIENMDKYVPRMVSAGLRLLTGVLNGVANNVGKAVGAATALIVAFINAISSNLPKVTQSGANLVIKFINSVANAIRNNSAAMGKAGANLGTAIVEGMVRGLASGLGSVISAAKNIASSAISAAKKALDINSPSKEFIKIGNSVNEGFYKGLTSGDKSKVDSAFDDLRSQLKTAMQDSAKDVDTLEAKLKKLTSARVKDKSAIADVTKELAQARKEHSAESAAYTELTKKLSDERSALDKLADKYSALTTKIDAANDALANAIKTRDDYRKSISDEFSQLPDITAETTVTDYVTDLKKQVEDTKVFANTLQRLRKMGLDDKTYQDLLSQGTSALPFVQSLLSGGQAAIDQINSLDKQLDSVAGTLGKTASSELYQAAVDSAAGLVKGLQNQQKAIEKQMDKIADAMVNSIKKKLGIKSPSRAFMEVGGYSGVGLAKGLEATSSVVQKSAAEVGTSALDSLRQSLSGFSDLVTKDVDLQPTITPVLDLSSVKKDAGQIGSMLTTQPISVDSAYSKAQSISSARMSTQTADTTETAQAATSNVTYNQYNNSPKALSAAEIYRQTKNQLSKAKEVVSTS